VYTRQRLLLTLLVFFFSSRRRHTRSTRDWSSDVCSSDLPRGLRWLPNVGRDDFRSSLLDEYLARGEGGPAAQEVPHFEEPARLRSEERRVGKEGGSGWWVGVSRRTRRSRQRAVRVLCVDC